MISTFSDVPSAPLNVKTGEITETTVALSWDLPNDNGGSDITGYVIERRDAKKTSWSKVKKNHFLVFYVFK